MSRVDPPGLAVDYLLALRQGGDPPLELESRLAALDADDLTAVLGDDRTRLAFWIDLYNAVVLRHPAGDLSDWRERLTHFRRPLLTVAGRTLSLDAIEHGLLRRSRWKLGLGYLANPLPSPFERAHRVAGLDPRVHFALNCGAASCPPIAAYRQQDIEAQLEVATRAYLATEVRSRPDAVLLPAILLWYLGDFGGPPGLRRLLRRHAIEGWNRPVRFQPYDWTPQPGRWAVDADR